MHKEIKKLTRSVYLIIASIVVAFSLLLWFLVNSFVTVILTPPSAAVHVDGKAMRYTSFGKLRLTLPPGQHTITAEADGYAGRSEKIILRRGFNKSITLGLKEQAKPVEVSASATMLEKGNDFNDNFYLGNDGKTLFKLKVSLDSEGNISLLENRPVTSGRLSGVKEIIWSPTKELALLRKSDMVTLFDLKKYDFVNQTETPWGEDIGSIAWSPDNSKIAYYYSPPSGEKSLIFANLTNTEINRMLNLKELNIENPILRWSPDSEWLMIIPRDVDESKNKIYMFNAYTRNFSELTDTGNQIDAAFSPDSNKIIYATYSKDSSSPVDTVLSVMDRDGANKRSLDLRAELTKTAWLKDSDNLVVATYDIGTKKESIFKFNTSTKSISGFLLKDLGDIFINSISITDDNRIVVYEDNSGIFAVKAE